MTVRVYTDTIDHSPNADLGSALSRRVLAGLPEIELAWLVIKLSYKCHAEVIVRRYQPAV